MNENQNLQILTAGYSMHRKPYIANQPDGLDNHLIRLQTTGKCRIRLNGRLELLEPGDLVLSHPMNPMNLE